MVQCPYLSQSQGWTVWDWDDSVEPTSSRDAPHQSSKLPESNTKESGSNTPACASHDSAQLYRYKCLFTKVHVYYAGTLKRFLVYIYHISVGVCIKG